MYKIGEFASLSRVSAKMLRHYAAIGLLAPAFTDMVTGYRYYTADQLERLNRIVVLKELGFPLEQVAALLAADVSPAQLYDALARRRAEVAQRIADEQRRLAELDRRLAQLAASARPPVHEILLRAVPPTPVAVARAVIASDRELAETLGAVEDYVERFRARAARPATVVYEACTAHTFEIEVAVPITTAVPDAAWVTAGTLAGASLMACVVHTGDDTGLAAACATLHRWIDANGYRLAGAYRERYLRFNAAAPLPPAFRAPHPEAAVTELQVPVVPLQAA